MTLHELRFSPWQCARARHKRSTCTRCADICPTRAITLSAPVKLAIEKCTGCGACAAVCPAGALETDPAATVWRGQAPAATPRPTLTLTCPRSAASRPIAEDRDRVEIACVGRLDEALLLEAVTAGPYGAITVDAAACATCPSRTAYRAAEQTVQRAQALFAAFGRDERIQLSGEASEPATTAEVEAPGPLRTMRTRRELLAGLLGGFATPQSAACDSRGAGVLQIDGSEEMPRGEMPVRRPSSRQRLLKALRYLGQPTDGGAARTGVWAQFGLTSACTGCQMCAFFCPTGALQKVEQDGKSGLAFRLADCTNCGLCQDVCFWNAVVLESKTDLNKVIAGSVDVFWHANPMTGGRRGHPGIARNVVS